VESRFAQDGWQELNAQPKIERDGEQLKGPMSSSGLWWADDMMMIISKFKNTYKVRY
jgi:hypothetical protein